MAALTLEQLQEEFKGLDNPQMQESLHRASEAVRLSKLILIAHRIQDFTGGDVVTLSDLIMRGCEHDGTR